MYVSRMERFIMDPIFYVILLANKELKWERTASFNLGLDFLYLMNG